MTLWASRRRKITNLVIVDDNGSVSDSAPAAAGMLSAHWSPKFLEQEVHLSLARIAISKHIQKFDNSQTHVVSFDIFAKESLFLKILFSIGLAIMSSSSSLERARRKETSKEEFTEEKINQWPQ